MGTTMLENLEQTGISLEEINNVVKEQVDHVLGTSSYNHNQISHWVSTVVEQVVAQLTKLNKPYKYIVNCVVMQKTGAGLHLASACYWDNATDVSTTVRWENKTMYCIVCVFACSI